VDVDADVGGSAKARTRWHPLDSVMGMDITSHRTPSHRITTSPEGPEDWGDWDPKDPTFTEQPDIKATRCCRCGTSRTRSDELRAGDRNAKRHQYMKTDLGTASRSFEKNLKTSSKLLLSATSERKLLGYSCEENQRTNPSFALSVRLERWERWERWE
jgi:hypothetical protein